MSNPGLLAAMQAVGRRRRDLLDCAFLTYMKALMTDAFPTAVRRIYLMKGGLDTSF